MLTRRHIRIKVMQSVYSFNLGQQNKLEQEVVFFKESVEQTFNLYLLLLGLLKSLHAYAEEQLLIIQKNKIQDETQFLTLQKFTQNRVLVFLKEHQVLAKQLDNKKLIKWDLEFKFLKDLFVTLSSSQVFQSYLALEKPSIEDDLKCTAKLFKNHVATSNYLYEYIEDGALITLTAISEFGCTDQAQLIIEYDEQEVFYIPNTFTPDGDNFNQMFTPVFYSGFDPFNFEMLIFNRWGEIVFETRNAEIGWDGTYGLNGMKASDGAYTWKITYKNPKTDQRKVIVGHVTLIR